MSKNKRRNQINSTTNYLIKRLKKEDVVIQKYKSKSSLSVYLKLDYGVLNSIRLSDHKGKPHLNYKYNILTICPYPISTSNRTHFGKVIRHYFPMKDKQDLLQMILSDRNKKMKAYGENNYKKYMKRELSRNSDKKGFWQLSKVI